MFGAGEATGLRDDVLLSLHLSGLLPLSQHLLNEGGTIAQGTQELENDAKSRTHTRPSKPTTPER